MGFEFKSQIIVIMFIIINIIIESMFMFLGYIYEYYEKEFYLFRNKDGLFKKKS